MSLLIHQDPGIYHEPRKDDAKPTFLIIHYTGTKNVNDAKDILSGRMENYFQQKVSAHYLVEEDGTVTQFVDESRRAYHAGVCYWEGNKDINTHSVGIELINLGWENGYHDFPEAQTDALIDLCKDVLSRHNIPAYNVLGHSDVSAGRRFDPGERFPWKKLADAGVGLWPQPIQSDFNDAATLLQDDVQLKQALINYGYDPALDLPVLVQEFQRHFQPEAFTATPPFAGTANNETTLRLAALVRQKLAIQP